MPGYAYGMPPASSVAGTSAYTPNVQAAVANTHNYSQTTTASAGTSTNGLSQQIAQNPLMLVGLILMALVMGGNNNPLVSASGFSGGNLLNAFSASAGSGSGGTATGGTGTTVPPQPTIDTLALDTNAGNVGDAGNAGKA